MKYRVAASTLAEQIRADNARDALAVAQGLARDGAREVKIRNESGAWFTIEEMERIIQSVSFG